MVEFVRKPGIAKPPSNGRIFWQTAFPQRHEWAAIFLIMLITLIGLIFRLVYILQPAGFDEAYTYLAYSSQPLIRILTDYSFPNNHIFHSLLVAMITRLIPVPAIWVMRLPAFVCGVLMIPAAFLAGRAMYHSQAGLLAAILAAASASMINFAAEARGYTLVCLMSLMMLWMAGSLTKHSHWSGWLVLSLAGILGAFTIPIMLYPLAAIYIWLVVDGTLTTEADKTIRRPLGPVFLSAGGVIVGTILVYLPVILWGTGLKSITSNGFVAPLGWDQFLVDMLSRLKVTWTGWTISESLVVTWGLIAGFGLSLVFHHRLTKSRGHLAVTTLLTIVAILCIQQVAPQPRIWQFLLAWFYLWVAAGWIGLFSLLPEKVRPIFGYGFIALAMILIFSGRAGQIMQKDYPESAYPGVEQSVAWILEQQIQPDEQIVVVLPSGTQVKYYYNQSKDYLPDFYNSSQTTQSFSSSYLVVVNTKYGETLESVVEKNKLQNRVALKQAIEIANYKQVDIYRIPALNTP